MPRYSTEFNSTALASADYDSDIQELSITFTNGRAYTYENVPENVWEGLSTARSAGSYFASQIKDRY